jgi:hypothetical protein
MVKQKRLVPICEQGDQYVASAGAPSCIGVILVVSWSVWSASVHGLVSYA